MNSKARYLLSLQAAEFSPQVPKAAPILTSQALTRLRGRLSSQLLREYDIRKKRFGASCVVPIESGVCTGCRVSLSLNTRRRAKSCVVECEHCGRLLYNPERRRRLRIGICVA